MALLRANKVTSVSAALVVGLFVLGSNGPALYAGGPYVKAGCDEGQMGRTAPPRLGEQSDAQHDDLLWLVGRWRCLTREYIGNRRGRDPGSPLGPLSEDFLEYLDVFYPYVDTNLTTTLPAYPKYRKICAQLLVRKVSHRPPFEEALVPMDPQGEYVEICRDRIRIGVAQRYTFKYRHIKDANPPRLVLESPFTRIVLIKWASTAGDVCESWVGEPVKFYNRAKREALEKEYRRLSAVGERSPGALDCSEGKRR